MPTLDFKGKQHIYAHHLTVPYRPIEPDETRSCNPAGADGNLIIHGDNLHALKALLPRYANRIKCIYIDPPYNTGSQEWVYNDRVNSPLMKAWLEDNKPVDGEDLERHDKWLCMMWPRLHLLRELLSEDGSIFVSIDDHEQWRLLGILEEVFGPSNFVATLSLVHFLSALPGKWLTTVTEYIHVFGKNTNEVNFSRLENEEDPAADWEQDELGYYKEGYGLIKTGSGARREDRPNLYFPIYIGTNNSISLDRQSPEDTEILPKRTDGTDGRWRWSMDRIKNNPTEILVKPHHNTGFQLIAKQRPNIGDTFTTKPRSLWYKPQYQSSNGTNILRTIFDGQRVFDYPKAVALVSDLLKFGNVGPDDIVLDSFAGSGTTAHAVLDLNKEDGGNRKFILIECEDYADTTTAERVRRVINGVPNARDESLREGLGGSFTYCTLGRPIEIEAMLTGETLPPYSTLAANLLYTTSGVSLGTSALEPKNDDGLFHSDDRFDYYMLYKPDLGYLLSNESILNMERAERIRDASRGNGKKAIVYAAGKYIGQRELTEMDITFCQLPQALHER